jgi:hypothetical protein
MKKYLQPNVRVTFINVVDVITTSQFDVQGSDIDWGNSWQS